MSYVRAFIVCMYVPFVVVLICASVYSYVSVYVCVGVRVTYVCTSVRVLVVQRMLSL